MSERLDVRKTYKLLINGAFARSESGRSYEVTTAKGAFLANVAQGSRKDLRDAVVAARAAQPKWWDATAYNRGQVLYRLAEMAESRRDELAEHVSKCEGMAAKAAGATVSRSIDRIVWYAGWTDKIAQVLGGTNPVAGPFFNFSVPVPSGVVAVIGDQDSSLEAFVDAVAVISPSRTATSDFPAGVLNIVTGVTDELAPVLAAHEDVDGIDLGGVAPEQTSELAGVAAGSIKRVLRPDGRDLANSLRRLRAFVETSTVWHTIGQ
jgi:acyl-CoA reductase-like NAD-dependent aldehyde dehydrogenase